MKKIIYVCDRCGKEIEADIIELRAGQLDPKTEEWEQMPAVKMHFHLLCLDDLMGHVKKEIAPVQKETKKKRGPHNPVNRDTVAALARAGWTYKEIANDPKVQCAENTVWKIIKELKEEGKL